MPAYDTLVPPTALYPGDSYKCINNETPASGTLSQQVALGRKDADNAGRLSVEITFSANPGVFEVDLMVSDTDNPNDYVMNNGIDAVDATFTARVEVNVNALFAALYTKTANANAALCTAKITQH
jgi:hypothetical protein